MGWIVGLECVPTLQEAATKACASMYSSSGLGVHQCYAVAGVDEEQGGAALQHAWAQPTGSVQLQTLNMGFQQCEVRDLAYYMPVITLWLLAIVTLLGVRFLRRAFDWERT